MFKGCHKQGKSYLLDCKKQWTHDRVGKASDETMNKAYPKQNQCEPNEVDENTEKALGKHVDSLYSNVISRVVKIRDAVIHAAS